MNSIEINGVSKTFGTVKALHEAALSIPEGSLFGLIGPDGSGKTTLFRLITTLMLPDRGDIRVFGYDTGRDFRNIRRFTGYMPGRFSLYPDLTVQENLDFYATIFGTSIEKNYALIEPVFALLAPFRKRLARDLSGGMKQKLALSCALIHNPRLLVLDEPTTGVDAVSRKEFWDTLHSLKASGMTILVSTPYMDEAVRCDQTALI
jgi:ABC-2 type transport system ATP-binding protein